MGSRNEEPQNKFLESPTHAAMIRALFPQAAFIPKTHHIKIPMSIKSATLHSSIKALLDSGATNNFIDPVIINRYSIATYKLPKPRIVRNVDGTKNNMGSMTHATNLKVRHNDYVIQLNFLIANLGGNSTLLGIPFLTAFNPEINCTDGSFPGNIEAFTHDSHKWNPTIDHQTKYTWHPDMKEDQEHDPNFIPNNQCDIVQL